MRKYFFLLLMVVFTSLTIGQTNDKSSTKLFEYPQNWGKYKTYKERLNALQIPQSQINKIVSDELLEICMNFPYVANLGCYYDLQLGLSNIERMFNGFRELNSRQDYSEVLIRKYRQLPFEISILKSATPIEIGAFSCKTMLLESMIIHAMNSSIFSNVQIDDIMYMAQKLLELKQELPAYFGSRSLATTKNVQSKCIDYLSEKSSNLDDNQLDAL